MRSAGALQFMPKQLDAAEPWTNDAVFLLACLETCDSINAAPFVLQTVFFMHNVKSAAPHNPHA
jgi:hypothetical protein